MEISSWSVTPGAKSGYRRKKMNDDYPDYIFFKRMDSIVRGPCKILNVHDGLISFILQSDKREHTIPSKSLIEIQRGRMQ